MKRRELRNIALYTAVAMLFWTGIATAFLAWNISKEKQQILDLVRKEARANFNRNIMFRRWVAKHGGVYVPATKDTPPNPFLAGLPERDLRTPSGRNLTLVNPAYAFRQLMEGFGTDGVLGHITSLEPIRPQNAPDAWEQSALRVIEKGAEEVDEIVQIKGKPYFHLMRPVMVEEPCLACHAVQGYREGDVRGGIGIAVPMESYLEIERKAITEFSATFAIAWLAGAGLIGFISLQAHKNVRERQQSEETLRRSEENLKKAQALAHIGSWHLDISGDLLTWSDEVCRIFGLPAGRPLSYDAFLASVHPEDRERVDRSWKAALRGEQYDLEHRITAAGTMKWVHEIATVLFDGQGKPREGIGTVQDVSDRKAAEAAIRESEERFRELFENSPVSLWEEDFSRAMAYLASELRGKGDDIDRFLEVHPEVVKQCAALVRILRVNRKSCELHGASDERELLEGLPRTFTDESYQMFRKELAALRRGITEFETDATVKTLAGELRDVIVRWYVPPGQAGTFSRILVSLLDITERKKMERFIHDVLENVGEGVAVIDPQYRIISANRAFCGLVAKQLSEVAGGQCYAVSHNSEKPCHESGEACPVRSTFETGLAERVVHTHGERTGKTSLVEIKSFPMKDSEGRVTAVIEMFNDITETKRLQEQLQQAQKMEAIGHLAGGVAHDFNNLLTAIIGYGNLIRKRLAPYDPMRRDIEQILAASERAADLTTSLLAFSRKQIISPKPANLNTIVTGMEKILRRLIGEDIELTVVLSDRKLVALVDKGQIDQVLMNLAANARDAMSRGGRLTIETSLFHADATSVCAPLCPQPGPQACISVSDTGAGMDALTREKIFEPFFTTKESGRGTGLGLSIVYGIVRQHNGCIDVASEPGKGTTFTMYFPLAEAAEQEQPEMPLPLPGGTETILLAEDDEPVRTILRTILETAGYRVVTAVDGEDAVQKFGENRDRISLVLLDVIMPRKDGREACEEMRKTSPDIKAVFMSGYTTDRIHQHGIMSDDHEFLSKPVAPEALLRKVRALLDAS